MGGWRGRRALDRHFAEAAEFGDHRAGDPRRGDAERVEMAGAGNFDGKVVIDATNPLDFSSGGPQLSIGFNDSLGERLQRWLPKARVVKAFNTVGNAHMIDPAVPRRPADDVHRRQRRRREEARHPDIEAWGWEVADLGGIEAARYLEPMCMAWVVYGSAPASGLTRSRCCGNRLRDRGAKRASV